MTPEGVAIMMLVSWVLGCLYGAYLWEHRGPDRSLRGITADARRDESAADEERGRRV